MAGWSGEPRSPTGLASDNDGRGERELSSAVMACPVCVEEDRASFLRQLAPTGRLSRLALSVGGLAASIAVVGPACRRGSRSRPIRPLAEEGMPCG
jgi:hypothetical protein